MRFLLFILLVFMVSCQKERKVCHFQNVEVACGALEEQQQALKESQSQAPEKPQLIPVQKTEAKPLVNSTEVLLPANDSDVALEVQVKRDKFKFEIIENRQDKAILNSLKGEYECDLSFNNGDFIMFSAETDMMEVISQDKKILFLRKDGMTGVARGTWIRKMKFKEGNYQILMTVNSDSKIQFSKSCSLN